MAVDSPRGPEPPELTHSVAHLRPGGILDALQPTRGAASVIVRRVDLVTPSRLDRIEVAERGDGLECVVEGHGDGQPFRQKPAQPVRDLLRFVVTVFSKPDDDQAVAPPKNAENAQMDLVFFDRTG